MNHNYIPEALKEKILNFSRFVYAIMLLSFSIFTFLALISFDINDNSFLTNTNNPYKNILGLIGSYYASFIFYTFGALGYLLAVYFFIYSFLTFIKKTPDYFFIRLLVFFLGLILMPQLLVYWGIDFDFYPGIKTWGGFSDQISSLHKIEFLHYILSLLGLLFYFYSQGLIQLLKIPRFNLLSLPQFKTRKKEIGKQNIKKEPIINNINVSNTAAREMPRSTIAPNINLDNKKNYAPSLEILDSDNAQSKRRMDVNKIKDNSNLLERVFADFNIEIKVINVKLGPVVTLYEILPAAGIKISTIINLADDISRSMGVGAVRIAQIYGTQYLGVEAPNDQRETVTIKELLSNENFKNTTHRIPICIGKDISGNIEVIDLTKTPHLLVAGTTGSGKSVFINTLLTSILYKFAPEDLRLILIDPKMLELSVYNDIAHLLTPVVTEPKKAIIALKWVCKEMERRYSLMNEESTRSLEGYNQKAVEKLPFIVVFIDEMADLMMTAGKEVEHYVQRLAQMARACGIHLVMATQRPSVDIITGSIKANFPSRISFQVASKYDSRTVLGEVGAEQLLGNGDMLMSKNGGNIIRYQSAFISDSEVNKLIKEIKRSQKVEYLQELDAIIQNNNENFDSLSEEDEELITKSIDLIKTSGKASTSYLQRNFQIGYNKAARIMESLEQRGVVSTPNHTGKRDILINQ
jgi:S-DNA-T family DNA segregation ATPase FtsK/SpoIIIE